ncbi:MAG: hypothetical protein IJO76_06505 [Clostridia bacterium]|nr:hypothetical protein [Clostridia bacterium]
MENKCGKGVYTPDIKTDKAERIVPTVPLMQYDGFLRPGDDKVARTLGDACVAEMKKNIIADFERTAAYCEARGEENPDQMVHVSTFVIIDGTVYMTYYANTGTDQEDPQYQVARLAYCPLDDPADMTVLDVQKVGEVLDGRTIDRLYDTILLYKGGEELYILWTASPDGNYYRLYRTFNIKTHSFGPIRANRFTVGDITNDFSISGMKAALTANDIPFKAMWSDIGIMQKLSTREENGETYYYTGAYSGNFNCIIKSKDFVTWEYVSTPDFINNSLWENATYVLGDKVYYFVRQQECNQGFLTVYDLKTNSWQTPFLIADTQSRSDFIYYKDTLYLIHAPLNRDGIGIVRVDTEDIRNSKPLLVADMKESCFYPYTVVYGDEAYISYTVSRKHIRLTKIGLSAYTEETR